MCFLLASHFKNIIKMIFQDGTGVEKYSEKKILKSGIAAPFTGVYTI